MNVNLELAASRGVTRVLPETLKRILFNRGVKHSRLVNISMSVEKMAFCGWQHTIT